MRCKACSHVYLNPRPSIEDLDVIYPENYYTLSGTGGLVARLQRVWEKGKVDGYRHVVGDGRRRILDVGCGDGRFLGVLEAFGPKEWEVVGIDFDSDAVEKCRAAGYTAYKKRVEDFEEGANSFDAVIMLQLIEHVADPLETSRKIFDLLKPGGVFVVETPNLAGIDYRLFKDRCWAHYHFPRHWNLFSTDSLHRMLEKAGYEVVRTDHLMSTSAWTISLYNYFLDRGLPGWFVRFFSYKNPFLLGIFVTLDTVRTKMGRETSNQRVIGRKPL